MNSFGSRATLRVGSRQYQIFRLDALDKECGVSTQHLPFSLRVLLENLLRTENGKSVTQDDIRFLAQWQASAAPSREIAFTPARVLMQDFTGVPAVVDLRRCAMPCASLEAIRTRSIRCSRRSW